MAARNVILDYAALYVAVLADYAKASGDLDTARELWPLAQRQLELLSHHLNANGIFVEPRGSWIFIDWQQGLDRAAPMHGVVLYSFRRGLELAQALSDHRTVQAYTATIDK